MPIHELLAQVVSEYESLQSQHDEALAEISFLRTRLAGLQSWDFTIKSLEDNAEVASPQQHFSSACFTITGMEDDVEVSSPQLQFSAEPLHRAPPIVNKQKPQKVTIPDGPPYSGNKVSRNESMDKASSMQAQAQARQSHRYLNLSGSFEKDDVDKVPEGQSLADRMIRFLKNPIIEASLVVIVITNVVTLIRETDIRASNRPKPVAFEILNWIYMALYITEFVLRVVAYRTSVFEDKWTRLDFAVIIVDIVSTIIQAIADSGVFGGFNASMFRVLRGFRLVRAFKVLRFVKELQLLIHGFLGAVKAVFWATGMLEIMVIMWSLIYVEVLQPRLNELAAAGRFEEEGCTRCVTAYRTVWSAHMWIWQQVVAGDSWGTVTMDLVEEYPEVTPVYLGALMTIQFAMLNLIFTVIVDAAIRTREEDEHTKIKEKEMAFRNIRDKLVNICQKMDADDSQELTLDELLRGYEENQEFADTMLSLDITYDDVATLFMIMDEDRSGAVSYMEFVNNIYKMREQDLHTMLMFVKGYVIDLRFKMKEDVTTLLRDNLKQSTETAHHMEAMMEHSDSVMQHIETMMSHIEGLVSNSRQNSAAIEPQQPSSSNSAPVQVQVQAPVQVPVQVPVQMPSFSNSTKELAFILEAQADILRAVQKKRSPHMPKTPKGLDSSARVLDGGVRPNILSPYLVVPKSTRST